MGLKAQETLVIQAPPERVWAMVADVTRMGEWSPETVRGEWLGGATGPAVGARFKGHNRHGRAKWSTTCEVIECEPGEVFAFRVIPVRKPSVIWRYDFAAADEGTTVTESFEQLFSLFDNRVYKLVSSRIMGTEDRNAQLIDGMRQTLRRLKAAAETTPAQT